MRKYIVATIIIGIGLILVTYSLIKNEKVMYSENIFSEDSKEFNLNFSIFLKSIEVDIQTIKENFNDSGKIKDTLYSRKFFLDFLKNNPHLLTVALIQDNYTAAVKRENKSLIFAIDSTKELDLVRWQRFEKGKLIGSWEESFEESINNTIWYSELSKNNNEIRWYFDKVTGSANKNNDDADIFYAGYSYRFDNRKNIMLFRFSRKKLNENFKVYRKYEGLSLIIETTHGKIMDLATRTSQIFQEVNKNELKEDSLSLVTLRHFKKFDSVSSSIFNFSYKKERYWNSFQRFPSHLGIQYYILTISDNDLILEQKEEWNNIIFWFSLFLIFIGIVILLIKKETFYRKRRIDLPSVKELLNEDEGRYLEFKSSLRWDYRQEKVNPVLEKVIFKTIAAFGNTDGGILLIGIDDDKNIIGLEDDFKTLKKSNPDYYEIHLRNLLHKYMGVKYVSRFIRMEFETYEDQKIVCKIKVFAADEPLYLKTKNKNGLMEEQFFVRSGNSSQEIKSIAEINDYINARFKN